MIPEALAQTLPSVVPAAAASTGFAVNYWYVGIGVAILIAIVVVVLFLRYRQRNPAGAAKVQAAAVADAQALGHAIAAAADKAVDKLLTARAGAPGSPQTGASEAQATLTPATEALPVRGRNGQPGTFTFHATGDGAVDIPAMVADYYRKEQA